MEKTFWHDHWQRGHIPFHQVDGNRLLREFYPIWRPPQQTILVPLCGKSVDMIWLASQGHQVIGVELIESAAREFFAHNQLAYSEAQFGDHLVLTSAKISIIVGDILSLSAKQLPESFAVFDRAAIVALPEVSRVAYAKWLQQICPMDSRVLMITISYLQSLKSGPPFSVDDDMVAALFSPSFSIDKLAKRSIEGKSIACDDNVYLLAPHQSPHDNREP